MNNIRKGHLDIGRCFNDAIDVYKKNILILLVSSVIIMALSFASFLILSGVLGGGYFLMVLSAMRREDKKVELKDMFQCFDKFLLLTGLFIIQFVSYLLGLFLLIVPMVLLVTIWLYSFLLMIDKNRGIIPSLKMSYEIVRKKGFGINLLLAVIYIALLAAGNLTPFLGLLVTLVVVPFCYLLVTSAYIQQVDEDEEDLMDILPDEGIKTL